MAWSPVRRSGISPVTVPCLGSRALGECEWSSAAARASPDARASLTIAAALADWLRVCRGAVVAGAGFGSGVHDEFGAGAVEGRGAQQDPGAGDSELGARGRDRAGTREPSGPGRSLRLVVLGVGGGPRYVVAGLGVWWSTAARSAAARSSSSQWWLVMVLAEGIWRSEVMVMAGDDAGRDVVCQAARRMRWALAMTPSRRPAMSSPWPGWRRAGRMLAGIACRRSNWSAGRARADARR